MRAIKLRWLLIGVAFAAIGVPVAAPALMRGLAPSPAPTPVVHSGASGIWGTVFFVCGGPAGGPPTCGPQPIKAPEEARIEVRNEGEGGLVSEFVSSETGTFEVELPRGRYLVLQSRKVNKRTPPCIVLTEAVDVPKGGWVHLNLACDNGVR